MKHTLTLHAEKTTSLLLKIVAFLLLAGLTSNYAKYVLGYDNVMGLVPLFSLSRESTIPSLFSTLILWLSAALLWWIAALKKKTGNPESVSWRVLCFVFIFLGLDELLQIHENFAGIEPYVSSRIKLFSKFMYWTLAYGVFVLLFALYFFRFYWHLPRQTKHLFAIAALMYVGGAIGMELAGAWFTRTYNMSPVSRGIFAAAEEGMEMTGVVLFIRALLLYIPIYTETSSLDLPIDVTTKKNKIAAKDRSSMSTVAFKKPQS